MTGRAFWAPLAARLRAVLADEQKRVKLLVLMGLAGLALLAVSAWLPAESTAPPAVQGESTADYAAQLAAVGRIIREVLCIGGQTAQLLCYTGPVKAAHHLHTCCYNIQRQHRIYDRLEAVVWPEKSHHARQS